MENWNHRKPEHSKRNQEERDEWEQLEQGHQEQDLMESFLAAEEQNRSETGSSLGVSSQSWQRLPPDGGQPLTVV